MIILLEEALNMMLGVFALMGMSLVDQANMEEVYCGATNIYYESRGEPDFGQLAVSQVVLNRVKDERYPNTVCEVVWQPKQFTWTHDGKSDMPKLENKKNKQAFLKAVYIHLIAQDAQDITNGALWYYAHDKINPPKWTADKIVSAVIGGHTFLIDARKRLN